MGCALSVWPNFCHKVGTRRQLERVTWAQSPLDVHQTCLSTLTTVYVERNEENEVYIWALIQWNNVINNLNLFKTLWGNHKSAVSVVFFKFESRISKKDQKFCNTWLYRLSPSKWHTWHTFMHQNQGLDFHLCWENIRATYKSTTLDLETFTHRLLDTF